MPTVDDIAGRSEVLDRRLAVDAQVAVRPEPFGALAYHYGTRRLVFLKHPDVVRVVRALDGSSTVREALAANGIEPARWPTFATALTSLAESSMLVEAAVAPTSTSTSGSAS